jgi:hypothetical protein
MKMKLLVPPHLVEGLGVCAGVDQGYTDAPIINLRLHFCGEDDCECWQNARQRILDFDRQRKKDV